MLSSCPDAPLLSARADDGARTAVRIGGLPDDVIEQAERRQGSIDWRPLAAALDGLFMAAGGSLSVRRFLWTPHERFSGCTPLEVIVTTPGGPSHVAQAALDLAVRTQLAKVS
jgi:hypothetical protein